MPSRVLIANRAEIARRVILTCRRLGIGTVAVYSDADAGEPHVREADEAVRIGPAPAPASYLDADALVRAAIDTGCDAVHPGYGFLAESPRFAEAVTAAGLTFVGPSAEVISLMGDKAAAKRTLAAAGVPVVPGIDDDTLDDAALIDAADDVGYPLLVKAVAGGGGKGMRVVDDPGALPAALAGARREAAAAFGDDRVILEHLVERPRHIEVQVFADQHGGVVHLLERECSVQRRHQKVVEEAPSPAVDEELRTRMGAAAVAAARTVGYEGAGTVEFLVDGTSLHTDTPRFHFLEMNTRLQVEHPVTEAVTGLDLVELQLAIADGAPLPFEQGAVRASGHAIEVRLYAEDPVDHLPQTGVIAALRTPRGVRLDLGVEEGSAVTRHYDPMLGKLVAHAEDRAAACDALTTALRQLHVAGVVTNAELLTAITSHEAFRAGDLTTAFLDEHLAGWRPAPAGVDALAAAATALHEARRGDPDAGDPSSPWPRLGAFRPGGVGGEVVLIHDVNGGDTPRRVTLRSGPGGVQVDVDGDEVAADQAIVADVTGDDAWVHHDGRTHRLTRDALPRHADASAPAGEASFTSPMPGSVLALPVAVGAHVEAGEVLALVEAMKMEHPVTAPAAGTVTAVHVAVGDAVDTGTPLVAFEVDEA